MEAVLNNNYETADKILNDDEVAGMKLFIDKANCTNCHNGPQFTNIDFRDTGVPAAKDLPQVAGPAKGAQEVFADEFNCLSVYSDAPPDQCTELNFLVIDEHQQERQFKPPSLRRVAEHGPCMHAGQFATLEEVLNRYNTAAAGHSELEPLDSSQKQVEQIIAFLKTLDSSIHAKPRWLIPAQE